MMDLRPLLWLCGGMLLWASAFLWLYVGLSIGCALSWQRGLTLMLATIWLLHLVAGSVLVGLSWRRAVVLPAEASPPRRFLAWSSCCLMAAGWVGILFVGWPLLLLEPCQ